MIGPSDRKNTRINAETRRNHYKHSETRENPQSAIHPNPKPKEQPKPV
ncbi:MAG TPA: hypothetical protein VLU95_06705 [Candidatus Acidoferrum sp.]|nr:hypothetical protein [Candidatus Acidoferrum sp.]